jgi:hypothetical protein
VAWQSSDEAVPGVAGTSHAWSKAATNPAYGAKHNLSAAMQGLLVDGKLQCVICHDPHTTAVPANPKTMHTSIPVGESQLKSGNLLGDASGAGTLTLTATPGASARGFRVKIQTRTAGGGTFLISHDYAWKADSWLNWMGAFWNEGTATGPGRAFQDGVAVPLDTAGASITLSAGSVVGDHWDFFITYPFLRYQNVTDAWCYQCHKEWQMNHLRVRGVDTSYLPNGVRKFSHPVGVGLNANGLGTDHPAPLDADGTAGSSLTDGEGGVANPTNDFVMRGGVVGCTTCHAVHNADSNSLTVDAH